MDWQTVINISLGSMMGIVGWFAREIWETIKDLRREIHELDQKMHKDFVRRDDFKDAMAEHKRDMQRGFDEVKELIGAVFKRVDNKQDRT
jgi:chorismate mutase